MRAELHLLAGSANDGGAAIYVRPASVATASGETMLLQDKTAPPASPLSTLGIATGTGWALAAGRYGWSVDAVERLGQNASGGGLSHTSHTREQKRVGNAVLLDSVLECTGNRFLAYDVLEDLRPPLEG